MSKDKDGKGGDYDVGYGKPPKEHRFKMGQSGNPAGAPSKRKRPKIDVAAVLNEPIAVKNSGVRQKMHPYAVAGRKLVERGLKQNDLNAILEFLELCETAGILVSPPFDHGGGVIVVPKGVNFHEWLESVTELVPASQTNADDEETD